MVTRQAWAVALMNKLGAFSTPEHELGLVAWESAENTTANWNPLATTEPAFHASNFNPVGVKNYLTLEQGLDATVATLLNGDYPAILAALHDEHSTAEAIGTAVAQSPWGTGRLALDMVGIVRAGTPGVDYYGHPVTGPADVPTPAPRPAPVPSVPTSGLPTNRLGATGGTVAVMQRLLSLDVGADLALDGQWGPATDAALRAFQAKAGLAVDGVIGPLTWSALIRG